MASILNFVVKLEHDHLLVSAEVSVSACAVGIISCSSNQSLAFLHSAKTKVFHLCTLEIKHKHLSLLGNVSHSPATSFI